MEKKDFRKLYEDLVKSGWFKKVYHDKSLGECPFEIPELTESEDERIRKWIIDFAKGQIDGFSLVDDEECNKIASQWRKAIAYLEKQGEQIPYIDFVIKPHKGDDSNPYDMSVSEAQEYATKRGFDIRFNDGEVYIDERHLTQTIGNILRWADEHPKEKKPNKEGRMRAWFIIKDGEVVGEPLGYPCEKAAVIEKMVLESRDDKGIYEIEPREFEIVFKKTENPE